MAIAPPIVPSSLQCARCAYDLTGTPVGGACPECGLSVQDTIRQRTAGPRTCGTATAAMVVGILSLAVCMLLGPVAIFLYYRAKAEMSMPAAPGEGYSDSSRTMARAGFIMGIIGTCIIGLYGVILAIGATL